MDTVEHTISSPNEKTTPLDTNETLEMELDDSYRLTLECDRAEKRKEKNNTSSKKKRSPHKERRQIKESGGEKEKSNRKYRNNGKEQSKGSKPTQLRRNIIQITD